MAGSALNRYSDQLRILSNIKANEVLLAALKLANPSGDNRRSIAHLEAENRELKSWSTLYEPFQLWFALKYRPEIRNNERITREAEYRMMELGRGAQPVYEWTPYGFRTAQNYTGFRQSIRDGLRDAGYKDVHVFIRRSAVTGRTFKQNSPFDGAKPSDYDLALVSPSMWRRLNDLATPMRNNRTRTGELEDDLVKALGIDSLQRSLGAQTGRKVTFMIYRSEQDIANRPGEYVRIELRIK
ncbi:hypothetical protein CU102_00380 [Phyllobacterium brassicacearum]|uniref:Uncharacterized protein n=1 Tax=Phyllobacterium brassicacearum TaxID=314235 RepID=A0A2P7BVU5_9HYPH|nr:hypothetical protein [Phyllobacterium brassicacearum]PSH70556.1 hypothetical protein CU102_00380 [Phyllobacterium brassicacearum]TDQ35992.1 hypothetical protein DEV91_101478 [Phyllobacterium brassicacearum]